MRLWLDIVRFECRLQMRSLRFRVGAALYLLIACAPPIVLATEIQPQAPHDFGPASYVGWSFDISRFAGLILAVVVAGNRAGETSQRRLWPVLSAASVGNGGYLFLRWAAMSLLLAAVSLGPLLAAFLTVTFSGLPPYDVAGYLVPWLLFNVASMTMMAAVWLSLVTITGSELGALMMLYLLQLGSGLFSEHVLERFVGSTFDFNHAWLGFYRLQWGLTALFESENTQWLYAQQLRSDGLLDIAATVDWWLARALPHLATAVLLLTIAVFFVRRTRSDVRPLVLREDHPLRNLLRFVHAARARYAPDAALGRQRWFLLLGLAAVAFAFFVHAEREAHFDTLAAERFALEMETDDQPTTPLDLVPTRRRIEGEVREDGSVRITTRLVLENRGEKPAAVAAFAVNDFLTVDAAADRSLELDQRGGRLFLRFEPPVAAGASVELELTARGRPREVDYRLHSSWGPGASFALLYSRHLRGPHRLSNLSLSQERNSISRRSLELGDGALTPTVRYTSWQLTDPPTVQGERGLELRPEAVQPVEDVEIDLRLPAGTVAADSCGHASIDEGGVTDRLRGRCRTAAEGYVVRGGPFRLVESGDVVLFAQPGHEENARSHLPAIEEVIALSTEAWPGLAGVDRLAALEWPPPLSWGRYQRESQLMWHPIRGWMARPPKIDGQLMSIPEARLRLRTPLSSVELVADLLTRRVTEQRALEAREHHVFRLLVGTAMSRRMGLASPSGASVSGAPWTKFWAEQPILASERRHQMLAEKVQALTVELIERTGAAAFYDGVNRFAGAGGESGESGTLEELFSYLEESSGSELDDFWRQYFEDQEALPEMRLGEVEVWRDGDTFVVAGEVSNVGTGVGRCPVVIKAEGRSRSVMIEVEGGGTGRFETRLDRQPLTAMLDPEKVCYRWVTLGSGLVERIELGEATNGSANASTNGPGAGR